MLKKFVIYNESASKNIDMNSVVISSDEEDNATENINFVAVPEKVPVTSEKVTLPKRKSSVDDDPLKIKRKYNIKEKTVSTVVLNDDGEDEEFQLDLHTKSKYELEMQKLFLPKPLATPLPVVNNQPSADNNSKTKVTPTKANTNSQKSLTPQKSPYKTIAYPPNLPKLTPKPTEANASIQIDNFQSVTSLLSPDVTVQKKNSQTVTTIISPPNFAIQENNLQTITTILPSDTIHPITTTIVPPEVALQCSLLSSNTTNGVTLTPVRRSSLCAQSSLVSSVNANTTTDSVTLTPVIKVRDIDSLKENTNGKNNTIGLNSSNLVLLNPNTPSLNNVQYVCIASSPPLISDPNITNPNSGSDVQNMSLKDLLVTSDAPIGAEQPSLFQITNVLSLADNNNQTPNKPNNKQTNSVASTASKRKRKSNTDPNAPKSKRGRKKKNSVVTEIISLDDDEEVQTNPQTNPKKSTQPPPNRSTTVNNQKNIEVIALDSDSDPDDASKNVNIQSKEKPLDNTPITSEQLQEENSVDSNAIFIIENAVENIDISSSDSENDENNTGKNNSSETTAEKSEKDNTQIQNNEKEILPTIDLESNTLEKDSTEPNTSPAEQNTNDSNIEKNINHEPNSPNNSPKTCAPTDIVENHEIPQITNENSINQETNGESEQETVNTDVENLIENVTVPAFEDTNEITNNQNCESSNDSSGENKNEQLFQQFLNMCVSETIPSKYTEIINKSVNKIRKRYQSADVNYINSSDFSTLLQKCISDIQVKPISVIISFREVLKQLKNNQLSSVEDEQIDKDKLEKIKKLEKVFRILQKKIRELEKAELDLQDDWDENSEYMKQNRYVAKLCQVHSKICELSGVDKNEGRKTLNFQGSQHPQINNAISKLYNKKFEVPNFYEVDKCIRKCIKRNNLNLTESEIETEVREMFKLLGRKLQKRRQKELHEDLKSYIEEEDEDPANNDPDLDKKLRESYKTGEERIQEVFRKYTQRQEQGEDIENDSENSYVESNDEDDEDTNDT